MEILQRQLVLCLEHIILMMQVTLSMEVMKFLMDQINMQLRFGRQNQDLIMVLQLVKQLLGFFKLAMIYLLQML